MSSGHTEVGMSLVYLIATPWLLVAALYYLWRRLAVRSKSDTPPPPRRERLLPLWMRAAEAVLFLLLFCGIAWNMAHLEWPRIRFALGPHAPGDIAVPFRLAFVLLGLALAAAVFLVMRGRVAIATWGILLVCVILLWGYTRHYDRDAGPLDQAIQSEPVLVLYLSPHIEGAQVWVNNTLLGKAPVTIGLNELKRKVKPLDSPPDAPPPGSTVALSRLRNKDDWSPWRRLLADVTVRGHPPMPYYVAAVADHEAAVFSTRFPYTDVRHQIRGNVLQYYIPLDGAFFGRKHRIARLIEEARIRRGDVDDEWRQRFEHYGRQGWRAMQEAAAEDASLLSVRDAYVHARFGLSTISTPNAAWELLGSIRQRVDERGFYSTDSPEGRSVEMIAPLLDARRLTKEAVRLIHEPFWMPNCTQYRYGPRGNQVSAYEWGTPGLSYSSTFHRPSVLAVAQAVYEVDRHLDSLDESEPNIIERRVVPELLRWRRGTDTDGTAAALGGPMLANLLIRQTARHRMTDELPGRDTVYIGSTNVNRWLCQLVRLRGIEGDRWRREHVDTLVELADRITKGHGLLFTLDYLGFLFLDPQLGSDSPAYRFWPVFKQRAREDPGYALQMQWRYLARMGRSAPQEWFIEAWAKSLTDQDGNWTLSPDSLKWLSALQPKRLADTLTTLRAKVVRDMTSGATSAGAPRNPEWVYRRFIEAIDKRLRELKAPEPLKT